MTSQSNYPRHPLLMTVPELTEHLKTNLDSGLNAATVQEYQQIYKRNELEGGGAIPWYTILSKQFFNAMVLVLLFAMILSFAINDYIEGGVLAFVIVANVTIGFFQELKAEKSMDALRALSSPSATVLRDGKNIVIPTAEVVPGDIVFLKMGDTVPADLRIFEAMNLTCDEKSLTGESVPVEKFPIDRIMVPGTEKQPSEDKEIPVGDRSNMAHATTEVRKGRGKGVVILTGMETAVGDIASSTAGKECKPGRSLDWKTYGKRQLVFGGSRRMWDQAGKFLGLTEGTPLQRKLARLAYFLLLCAILLAIVVFGVHEFNLSGEIVIYAVSLGIAIIPESLVAVLTITMVVAVKVMRDAHVVVRDLSALEALGGVTNICSDKTGTLTQGAMIVRKAWLPPARTYTVHDSQNPNDPSVGRVTCFQEPAATANDVDQTQNEGVGNNPPALTFDIPEHKQPAPSTPKEEEAEVDDPFKLFLWSSALCNLATVRYDRTAAAWHATGEPTEIALQVFAHRFELGKKTLEAKGWTQLSEFPFDSKIKRMSVIYDRPENEVFEPLGKGNSLVFTKGAVERVLDLCTHMGLGESCKELTEEDRQQVMEQMSALASEGQRVLAVAYREWDGRFSKAASTEKENDSEEDSQRHEIEQGLCLLGLAGIYDPPRRETKPSIQEASTAGIRVHMLTGDHPETAKAIAKEVGIIPRNLGTLPDHIARSAVVKATDFDAMTDEQIDALEELPLVIARCAPDTKTRMIEALRRRNAFMAMTGDGVNDAPSLARADVGIAMGSGSDVAKGASKIVLTDDKFNSIVSAIRQGRRMFDNIQKFILHLLTSNVGEVILLCVGLAFKDNDDLAVFPISPLEVLWINMVTSSFPAFGLGREFAAADVMRRPPIDKKRGVFTNEVLVDMFVYGFIMGASCITTFAIIIYGKNDGRLGYECNKEYSEACIPVFRARACVFAELTWMILLSAWEFKNLRRSVFRLNPDNNSKFAFFQELYANKFLFWAVVIGALSVFPAVHIPGLNRSLFKHTDIDWEWAVAVGFTIVFVVGIEIWKAVKRYFGILERPPVPESVFLQGGIDARDVAGPRRRRSTSGFKEWRTSTFDSLRRSTSRARSATGSVNQPEGPQNV